MLTDYTLPQFGCLTNFALQLDIPFLPKVTLNKVYFLLKQPENFSPSHFFFFSEFKEYLWS